MAYSDDKWDKVKVDYEVHSLSYESLSKKHKIARSAISARAKKQGWIKGKTDGVISKKVIVKQELMEIEKETGTFSNLEVKEINKAVCFSLEMIGIYEELEKEIASKTMSVAQSVDVSSPMASMSVKNLAQTLQALKDKGTPATQINIQNNGDIAKRELKTLTLQELKGLRGTI